jgi:hypothetical protein
MLAGCSGPGAVVPATPNPQAIAPGAEVKVVEVDQRSFEEPDCDVRPATGSRIHRTICTPNISEAEAAANAEVLRAEIEYSRQQALLEDQRRMEREEAEREARMRR